MGSAPSTPRKNARPRETAEYLIRSLIGEKTYPLASDFWQTLLELPLDLRLQSYNVRQACELFAQNNFYTRHLSKILLHLSLCLRECTSNPDSLPVVCTKAVNAVHISSVFLKHLIENTQSDKPEGFFLYLDKDEAIPDDCLRDQGIEYFVMQSVLSFLASADISPHTFLLHNELLNFLLVVMSTQLVYGPFPEPKDANPFVDAAMAQDKSLAGLVVQKLLLNYVFRQHVSHKDTTYSVFSDRNQPGVLQKVGLFAANVMLFPLNYFASSSSGRSRSLIGDNSLLVLLILIHYHKRVTGDKFRGHGSGEDVNSSSIVKECIFAENPYRKALQSARDIETNHVDIEGNANNGFIVRLPFGSLFDTLGMFLTDETAVLLLYSLLHGNSDFLEYVLVRIDLDTLLMPLMETLYHASRRTSYHIYMILIVLLILSQDSSFNACIHKIILPSVSWYQECILHQTSLGSLMVIILIRAVKINLSKLQDAYLFTSALAVLANMAPHVEHLTAYASQRLVGLFHMLARKYTKLSQIRDDKLHAINGVAIEGKSTGEKDTSAELSVYTDFVRIVLEIINGSLTYALPRNPEVVYAVMQRQEVFMPFKSHPRFHELLENIYTVLDFFNSRMDTEKVDGEWSVEKVLQVIVNNCRFWRGEGMKMFTELRFTYEQESRPEEFFIPYVWQLILPRCGLNFDPKKINLFSVDRLQGGDDSHEMVGGLQGDEFIV